MLKGTFEHALTGKAWTSRVKARNLGFNKDAD
jgi:hypothetical protein